jgi:hypothetical protein
MVAELIQLQMLTTSADTNAEKSNTVQQGGQLF